MASPTDLWEAADGGQQPGGGQGPFAAVGRPHHLHRPHDGAVSGDRRGKHDHREAADRWAPLSSDTAGSSDEPKQTTSADGRTLRLLTGALASPARVTLCDLRHASEATTRQRKLEACGSALRGLQL